MPSPRLWTPDRSRTSGLVMTDVRRHDTALHEAGHIVLIEHVGGRRVGKARIFQDGTGHACEDVEFPADTPVACRIAVFLAGATAQNVHLDDPWCWGDKDIIREYLEDYPLDDTMEIMAQARRITAFGLKSRADDLARITRRLERTGKA